MKRRGSQLFGTSVSRTELDGHSGSRYLRRQNILIMAVPDSRLDRSGVSDIPSLLS